ncbi:MAG: hypothetical protein HY722_11750 [Planctomycetes bacterium]|nr:hypothetical protein [Planctomycetota bacterium]
MDRLRGRRRPASQAKVQETRLRHFARETGIRKLTDITQARLERYLAARREAHGLNRAGVDRTIIRTFARWCVRMDLMAADPCQRVSPLPAPAKKPIRFLSREEAGKMLDECETDAEGGNGATVHRTMPLHTIAMIGLYAGLRLGETLALRWGDLDFAADDERGLLHVRVRDD